jgi:hypothetical protein
MCKTRYDFAICACGRGRVLPGICWQETYLFMFLRFQKTSLWTPSKGLAMAWKRIRISLESWMVSWYKKQNHMSRCLKSHASVSHFFCTKRTHSPVRGLKGEALFLKLLFFVLSADRKLVQISVY